MRTQLNALKRASAEHRLAAHHENKAANAQHALDKRSTPDFCVRRIKEATADISRLERNKTMYASDMTHWQGCMDTAMAKRDYWREQLTLLGWADERPQNTPANPTACKHKDFGWFDVARVNAKTVTVKNWLGVATMTYKLPLEEITEWKPDLGQSQE